MNALVPIRAADIFCGAGGTSSGLYLAADELHRDVDLLAVNHWEVAIATHKANHREALHLCETLDGVNPRRIFPRGKLDLLVASPECTHHSNARGGRPREEQSRASAWHVIRWAEALRIESILIENVREFLTWGPLGYRGEILKSRKGETFNAWIAALKSLNYRVTYGILNAADYGDPTTRERLFVMAKLGLRRPMSFPAPTHSSDPAAGLPPWRSARDHVIDWSDRGRSILNRKRPLSLKTIGRIAHGFYKHGDLDLRPFLEGFLVKLYGTGKSASARRPLPAVTAKGGHLAVAQPMLLSQASGGVARPVSQPAMTVAGRGAVSMVESCLIEYYGTSKSAGIHRPLPATMGRSKHALAQTSFITEYHGGKSGRKRTRSTDSPLGTQDTNPRFGVAQPSFILPKRGRYGKNQPRNIDQPSQTVVPHHGLGHLVQTTAFMTDNFGERKGQHPRVRSVEQPASAVTGKGAGNLAQGLMLSAGGPKRAARPTDQPAHTVLTRDGIGLAQASTILPVTHTGRSKRAHDPRRPLPAVTTAKRGELAVAQPQLLVHGPEPVSVCGREIARAAIVQVELDGRPWNALELAFDDGTVIVIDILFRMLRPRELARAQGFPDDYKFTGKTEDVVKQIGNAVPVNLAKALCKAALA